MTFLNRIGKYGIRIWRAMKWIVGAIWRQIIDLFFLKPWLRGCLSYNYKQKYQRGRSNSALGLRRLLREEHVSWVSKDILSFQDNKNDQSGILEKKKITRYHWEITVNYREGRMLCADKDMAGKKEKGQFVKCLLCPPKKL